MKFRIAKRSDIASLAKIHMECGKFQPDGFMHNLGFCFLKTYYRLLIEEKNSIILLAEDDDGFIHGFNSGTLTAEEHLDTMKRNRIKIAFSLIPAFIKSPNILRNLVIRNNYIKSGGHSGRFGITKGPRVEYWAWRPNSKNPETAITLLESWLMIVFELGFNSAKGEVDIVNKNILKIHLLLGAKVIEELELPDGRKRVIIEYQKNNINFY
jgi:hypothetical protein